MMAIRNRLAMGSLVVFALVPVSISAQGLSGSLSRSVKDEQGGILAGASIVLASPVQIGGDQRTTTDDKGRWRFPVLAPGVYALVVEKTLRFGDSGRVELVLDVLNLLDDTAEEALVSDVLASATFGRPRSFVDPRRAMLGVRLHLGR
jgi:Carboxypeptidase regulatory-like domain